MSLPLCVSVGVNRMHYNATLPVAVFVSTAGKSANITVL